jgi:hypothetical protein
MIEKLKSLELDISKVQFNSKGVINFFWPYDNESHLKIYSEFTALFNNYIRGKSSEDLEPLIIFYKWLIHEILSIYKANKIVELLKDSQYNVNLPSHYKKTNILFQSRKLKVNFFENQIKSKLGDSSFVKGVKKFLKFFIWNKNFDCFRKFNQTVCLSNGKIIDKHASIQNTIRFYHQFNDYFTIQPSLEILNSKLSLKNQKITNEILFLIKQTFESNNERFNHDFSSYFNTWIKQAFNFYYFHFDQLSKRSLPKKIWIGCPGNSVWHVMLTSAVRKRSGKVYAHSHGSPNFEIDQTFENYVNLIHCDEYFIESKSYADFKIENLDKRLMFGKNIPKLDYPPTVLYKSEKKSHIYLEKDIKKIMYVTKPFFGEEASNRSEPSEIQYFDWQCRLLGLLSKKGIEVFYKPHPQGRSKPSKNFASSFGAKEVNQPFEKHKEQVDAYLIDFITSTTTHTILNSDLPVIFINLKSPDISVEIKKKLKERCYLIDSFIDGNNRYKIDTKEMFDILEKKDHKFNYDFCDSFYGKL